MVDTTKIDESTAQKVVDSFSTSWSRRLISADAKLGLLSGMEAREDWGILRQETDAALPTCSRCGVIKELQMLAQMPQQRGRRVGCQQLDCAIATQIDRVRCASR